MVKLIRLSLSQIRIMSTSWTMIWCDWLWFWQFTIIFSDSDYFDELDDDELERLEEAAKVLDMEEEVGNCPLLFLIIIMIMRCALLSRWLRYDYDELYPPRWKSSTDFALMNILIEWPNIKSTLNSSPGRRSRRRDGKGKIVNLERKYFSLAAWLLRFYYIHWAQMPTCDVPK